MTPEMENALNSLRSELAQMSQRMNEIKKAINTFLELDGQPPEFDDVQSSISKNSIKIDNTTFLGMDLGKSVNMFLKQKGRAATAKEILHSLKEGGFQFTWASNQLKNLAIFLGQNSKDYISFKTATGKMYGLWEHYPDKKKEDK